MGDQSNSRNRRRLSKTSKANSVHSLETDEFVSLNQFEFHEPFEESTTNGLYFNNIYLPKEVLQNILSYIPPKDLLGLTLVCKKWCNIIKSENFWMKIYNGQYPTQAKKLPWYIFYCYFTTKNFHNLLKNGNGQEQFKHWTIITETIGQFKIEDPPVGSDALPPDVPDFNGFTSCFVPPSTSCNKIQVISLKNKRLLRYILNKFKPHIYVSEWVVGKFDYNCLYKLAITAYSDKTTEEIVINQLKKESRRFSCYCVNACGGGYVCGHYECDHDCDNDEDIPLVPHLFRKSNPPAYTEQWRRKNWEKIEILVENYPINIMTLIFEHEGRDINYWADHYGSKMAGGVVRIVFDSIQPLENSDEAEASHLDQSTDIVM